MIHYHGGPISGVDSCAYRAWERGHAFISFAHPKCIQLASSITESFALDNGAFSVWKKGKTVHWPDYYAWCEEWLSHPACDWAIIPDVIEGTEAANDALIAEWPFGPRGVPVWHLNESLGRLRALADDFPRVALGSTSEYTTVKAKVARLNLAVRVIANNGRPKVKLHGLRMLDSKIVTRVPLSSADSTNLARNIGIDRHWSSGNYLPASKETRVMVLRERIEQHQSPDRLVRSF